MAKRIPAYCLKNSRFIFTRSEMKD